MNIQSFLDSLLENGKEVASKGQQYAEDKLNIPAEGKEREAALSGVKTGALAAGALALLLGTKTGRTVTGNAVKLGGLAAIGMFAWNAYQNKTKGDDESSKEQPLSLSVDKLEGEEAEERSKILLQAMIAAAKCDGVIDNEETARIDQQLEAMGVDAELKHKLSKSLTNPLSADAVARLANGDSAIAAEIYLVSTIVANKESFEERLYLQALAKALDLSEELVAKLDDVQSRTQ